ncbi:MAG: pilus assembly protein PilM [Gammaproteobacteria bacterium]|nr:pilus assembly protein PilM [Gammaproteobacteria bacterium]
MEIFAKKQQSIIGVDISSSAVKVLELSKSGDHYRVERYTVDPLPQNAVVENAITDVDQVGHAVERAIKRSGTRCKHAAVAVAASHVITKMITMGSGLNESELETQIELEADHYIPYPLDEVNLDFEVIGPSETDPNQDEVLISACRKEIVDDYIAVIEQAGLTPAVVDVESYAMESAYSLIAKHIPGGGMEKTIAILDFGATTMHMNVMHNNRSVYTRDHAFGGKQLTEEIQRRYGLSYAEAGLAKKVGGLPDNYQTDILHPFMEAMCQETTRALQFFYSSSQFSSVDQVLIAGGCAQILGVDELIANRAGIHAAVANPFTSMSLASRIKPQSLSGDAPSLMVACGLAMRSFDQ